jgi:hypothetical protein
VSRSRSFGVTALLDEKEGSAGDVGATARASPLRCRPQGVSVAAGWFLRARESVFAGTPIRPAPWVEDSPHGAGNAMKVVFKLDRDPRVPDRSLAATVAAKLAREVLVVHDRQLSVRSREARVERADPCKVAWEGAGLNDHDTLELDSPCPLRRP